MARTAKQEHIHLLSEAARLRNDTVLSLRSRINLAHCKLMIAGMWRKAHRREFRIP